MTDINRRTYLKGVGGTGVALSVAGCSSLLGGSSKGEIVPGTASGFPPFEFINESGNLVGFDIDLLSAVVEQTDYELGEWQDLNFDTLITALQNDQIDTIAAAMTITEKRDQTIDFSNPYYDANQAVLVRESSDFRPSTVEDLEGHPVGAQSGTTGQNQMKKLVEEGILKPSQTTTYENYVLAVQDLVNGNVDAVIVDTPVAKTFVEGRPVVQAFTIQTGEQYGFGVRENDDDRRKALNDGLQAVRENGTYAELTRKWFASE
ncbi:MAG: transporter substrate-binding domain-containing protein [Halobacterium sp.]